MADPLLNGQCVSLRCCSCQRFVSPDTAHQHIESGDYGTVHSVEFECERCADPGYRCCGVVGGCGGPCAAYPCWELST
jgi:hypothetical protein